MSESDKSKRKQTEDSSVDAPSPNNPPSEAASNQPANVDVANVDVVVDAEKLAVAQAVGIKYDDVLAYREYSDHVVVVTIAGQKLRGDKP